MNYKVIRAAGDVQELIDVVNRNIEDGWLPIGGITSEGGKTYLQAMVIGVPPIEVRGVGNFNTKIVNIKPVVVSLEEKQ